MSYIITLLVVLLVTVEQNICFMVLILFAAAISDDVPNILDEY